MVLNIYDIEDLNYIAEEIIVGLRYMRYRYDEEGNYLEFDDTTTYREDALKQMVADSRTDYLNFQECEELRKIPFITAVEMTFAEIKDKYLKDDLKMMRNILRKGSWEATDISVDASVTDEYLDNLFALRWKENLKLWTMQWEIQNKNFCQ